VRMPDEVPLFDDIEDGSANNLQTTSPPPDNSRSSSPNRARPATNGHGDSYNHIGNGVSPARPRAVVTPPKRSPQDSHANGDSNHVQTNGHSASAPAPTGPRSDENSRPPVADEELPRDAPPLRRKATPFPGNPPTLNERFEQYDLLPALEDLRRMSPAQLQRVKDFAIKSKHGEITWPGETDVSGLDIDSTVRFEPGVVEVYPDPNTCPPVGKQLNKRAEIRLFRCFPPHMQSLTPQERAAKLDKYSRKLKKQTDAIGAKFLGYDPERGEWHFEVQHFGSPPS